MIDPVDLIHLTNQLDLFQLSNSRRHRKIILTPAGLCFQIFELRIVPVSEDKRDKLNKYLVFRSLFGIRPECSVGLLQHVLQLGYIHDTSGCMPHRKAAPGWFHHKLPLG